jgi:hypothetical protein
VAPRRQSITKSVFIFFPGEFMFIFKVFMLKQSGRQLFSFNTEVNEAGDLEKGIIWPIPHLT